MRAVRRQHNAHSPDILDACRSPSSRCEVASTGRCAWKGKPTGRWCCTGSPLHVRCCTSLLARGNAQGQTHRETSSNYLVPTASRKLAVGFKSATAAHVRSRNPQPPDPVSLRCVVAQAALRARRGATLSKAIPSCHRQQTTGRKHITDRSKGARTHTDGQLARLSL